MLRMIRFFEEVIIEKTAELDDTPTLKEQVHVEKLILQSHETFTIQSSTDPESPLLRRKDHIAYLKESLTELAGYYDCLDASRPWLCFWIINSLWLLDSMPDDELLSDVVKFLAKCQHEDGGYGGGPGQYAHLAPTYAAINVLASIGTEEAYESINRKKLREFLWSVRSANGCFAMHKGGEVDVRGAYCALNVALLTNIKLDSLFDKTAEWIISCQTYEGGFAGTHGMEAHGGYAFCAVAALTILNRLHSCDLDSLTRWCVNRQMKLEGGFQGRTNKLVDGCYSFWQGAVFPLLHAVFHENGEAENIDSVLFNQSLLQEYILLCCEHHKGGFLDKPGKKRDLYHTNYVLCGLSIAQFGLGRNSIIMGSRKNKLNRIHPIHCIAPHMAYNMGHYFLRLPLPEDEVK